MKNLIALGLLVLCSCNTPANHTWTPTIGIQTTVFDSYTFDLSGIGYSGDVDYSTVDIQLGATEVSEGEDRLIKHQFMGVVFGSGDLEGSGGVGLDEISGGGRYYFDKGGAVIPFASIYTTASAIDVSGIGSQLGIRIGGGVEYPISRNISMIAGADYLISIVDATDYYGYAVGSIGGLAARFGIIVSL